MAAKHWGIDFAYGNGVTTAQLKSHGVEFVCRYLSGGNSKDISAAELKNYKAAGIAVVLNWETSGNETSAGEGIADAHAAQAELNSLSRASGIDVTAAPVIFSPDDYDPHLGTAGTLAYMHGAASVLGWKRVGLYGGFLAIAAYFNANIGKYGWQTYAWSGGAWDTRAQLQQWSNNVPLGPTTVDNTRAMTDDYGQAIGGVAPAPKPQPKPKPPAPKPAGPVRHVADGSQSLDELAAARKTTVKWIVNLSADHMDGANCKAMLHYLAGGTAAKMPRGLIFYTSVA